MPDFRWPRLVARNLANRPYRTVAVIFSFAIISATLFSSQYLVSGARQSLDVGTSRMGADLLVVPEQYAATGQTVILIGQPNSFFFSDSGYEKIARIPGVARATPQIYLATLFASCCAAPVQMIAIDPERDFTITPWLKRNPGIRLGKDDMIIGSAIIQNVGNDLFFYGHRFRVVGVLEQTGMGIDNSVFIRAEDARVMAEESGVKAVRKLTIPEGMVSAVLVKVDPGNSVADVAAEIRRQVPGTKIITPDGLLNSVSGQLGAVTLLLNGSSLAAAVACVPLLGFVSAMVAHERRREVSVMRALGATRMDVAGLMLAESFSLSVIGGLIGILGSLAVLIIFQDFIMLTLKVPFLIPSPLSMLMNGSGALLLTIGIGGLSSLYPAVLIFRSAPYDAIRRGES